MFTVYNRMYCNFPAKNTAYTSYIRMYRTDLGSVRSPKKLF